MQNVHLTTTCRKDYSPLFSKKLPCLMHFQTQGVFTIPCDGWPLPHALTCSRCLYFPVWWLTPVRSCSGCLYCPSWWLTPSSCTFKPRVSFLCDGWPLPHALSRIGCLYCPGVMAGPLTCSGCLYCPAWWLTPASTSRSHAFHGCSFLWCLIQPKYCIFDICSCLCGSFLQRHILWISTIFLHCQML